MTIRPERMVIMNFSELKQRVSPADPMKPQPGVKQLQEGNANIIANCNVKDENSITVYDSGYVLFRSGKDCFDIRELGKQLKKIGMLVVQDQVWNRVTMNRYEHKATRYYMDELHLLLKEK